MTDMNAVRDRYIRQLIAWMRAETETPPGGESTRRGLVPRLDVSKNCWDTHPLEWRFSEYGREV